MIVKLKLKATIIPSPRIRMFSGAKLKRISIGVVGMARIALVTQRQARHYSLLSTALGTFSYTVGATI